MAAVRGGADLGAPTAARTSPASRFGKRKLAPTISPGKTWEGVAGGARRGRAARPCAGWLAARPARRAAAATGAAALVATVAFSIVGDLFESLIKRHAGAQGFRHLFPGHGGMLDRLDSLFAALPVFALGQAARRFERRRFAATPAHARVAVLGATGSIGASALDVIARHPDRFERLGADRARDVEALLELLSQRSGPRIAVDRRRAAAATRCARGLRDAGLADAGARAAPPRSRRSPPTRGRHRASPRIVGAAGLASTLAAARAGKRVLLANKEAIVMAGALLHARARATAAARCCRSTASTTRCSSACRAGYRARPGAHGVERIVLTASGGPFRGRSARVAARGHARRGLRASELGDGPQDLGRFGDADEQGPRGDRGALAVRPAGRRDRGRGASAEHRPLAGRLPRRLGARAARQSRHAHRARLRAGLAASASTRGSRRSTWSRPAGSTSSRRTGKLSPAWGSPTRRSRRRHRAGHAERRQRSRGRRVPRTPARPSWPFPTSCAATLDRDPGDRRRNPSKACWRPTRRHARSRAARSAIAAGRPGRLGTHGTNSSAPIWWLLVTLGVLVTFHEFGHFVVARRLGVRVLRFSVGFGKPLWSRIGQRRHRIRAGGDPARRLREVPRRARGRRRAGGGAPAPSTASRWERASRSSRPARSSTSCSPCSRSVAHVRGRQARLPAAGRPRRRASPPRRASRAATACVAVGGQPVATWSEASLALATRRDRPRARCRSGVIDGARRRTHAHACRSPGCRRTARPRRSRALGFNVRQFTARPLVGEVAPGSPAARGAARRSGDRDRGTGRRARRRLRPARRIGCRPQKAGAAGRARGRARRRRACACRSRPRAETGRKRRARSSASASGPKPTQAPYDTDATLRPAGRGAARPCAKPGKMTRETSRCSAQAAHRPGLAEEHFGPDLASPSSPMPRPSSASPGS